VLAEHYELIPNGFNSLAMEDHMARHGFKKGYEKAIDKLLDLGLIIRFIVEVKSEFYDVMLNVERIRLATPVEIVKGKLK
jgi:hypothetical protein